MKTIVIGFSRPKKKFLPVFSWLIRLIQGTAFSHCYVRWFSETYDEPLVYEASGTQVRFVGSQAWKNHVEVIHEFELDISDVQFKAFVKFCMSTSGMPYSSTQIFGIALVQVAKLIKVKMGNPLKNGKRGWVCSELVGYLLNDIIGVAYDYELDSAGPKEIYELVAKIPTARRLQA